MPSPPPPRSTIRWVPPLSTNSASAPGSKPEHSESFCDVSALPRATVQAKLTGKRPFYTAAGFSGRYRRILCDQPLVKNVVTGNMSFPEAPCTEFRCRLVMCRPGIRTTKLKQISVTKRAPRHHVIPMCQQVVTSTGCAQNYLTVFATGGGSDSQLTLSP